MKLVSSDMALSRLEESVVQDIELERRMATLRSTNSRGERSIFVSADQTYASMNSSPKLLVLLDPSSYADMLHQKLCW